VASGVLGAAGSHVSIVPEVITREGLCTILSPNYSRTLLLGGWVYKRPKTQPYSAGLWQTASALLPSGSRTKAP